MYSHMDPMSFMSSMRIWWTLNGEMENIGKAEAKMLLVISKSGNQKTWWRLKNQVRDFARLKTSHIMVLIFFGGTTKLCIIN